MVPLVTSDAKNDTQYSFCHKMGEKKNFLTVIPVLRIPPVRGALHKPHKMNGSANIMCMGGCVCVNTYMYWRLIKVESVGQWAYRERCKLLINID